MRAEWKRRFAAGWAAILLTSAVVVAQNPTLKTRTHEERESAFQFNHRIILNVQVTDAAGKRVTDLGAGDFSILDNSQPRKLVSFHAIDGQAMNDATEIVILLDAVNTPAALLDAKKAGIYEFFRQSHGEFNHPTAFVLWSNGHLKSTGITRDRNAVGKAFVSMTKNLHSNACGAGESSAPKTELKKAKSAKARDEAPATLANCLDVHRKDSLAALDGIAQQQAHIGGRTILIWAGSGWPTLSADEFAQLTPKARKAYTDEFATILNDLRIAQITVDALEAEGPAAQSANRVAGSAAPLPESQVFPSLTDVAQQTGGRVVSASHDVTADVGDLVHDAGWYYALAFSPPPASKGVERRSLAVKVNRPGLNVRTITGYYTDPY